MNIHPGVTEFAREIDEARGEKKPQLPDGTVLSFTVFGDDPDARTEIVSVKHGDYFAMSSVYSSIIGKIMSYKDVINMLASHDVSDVRVVTETEPINTEDDDWSEKIVNGTVVTFSSAHAGFAGEHAAIIDSGWVASTSPVDDPIAYGSDKKYVLRFSRIGEFVKNVEDGLITDLSLVVDSVEI